MAGAKTLDKTNSMWNEYDNSQGAGNQIGSAVGGLAGKLAGNQLFGKNPGIDQNEDEQYVSEIENV